MRRAIMLFLLLMGCSPLAWSACTVTPTNGVFGTVTSFALNSTEQEISGSLTVQCDAVLLNLLTGNAITMQLSSASAAVSNRAILRRVDNPASTDTIPVRLCGAAGCNNNSETLIGGSYTWSGNALLDLLNTRRIVLPIYFRTLSGQTVAAGQYQATFNLNVTYNICSIGLLGGCGSWQTGTVPLAVTATISITNDCITIAAPNVNFGSAPLVKNFPAVAQGVAVTCTKGSVYSVGINNGSNASGNVRNMASGNNRLSYEIYKGSTSDRWGSSGTERWASSASSLLSANGLVRTYNYTARVLTNQATPPAGTYSDTVVVDIAF